MVRRVGWSGCGSSPTVLPSRMGVIIGWKKGVTFESKLTTLNPDKIAFYRRDGSVRLQTATAV